MTTLLLLNLSFILAIMLLMLWILNHLPFDFLEGQKALATMYVDIIQEQRLKYVTRIYTSLHNTGGNH